MDKEIDKQYTRKLNPVEIPTNVAVVCLLYMGLYGVIQEVEFKEQKVYAYFEYINAN